MSFITAQQTKLDLELVPNEKRLEIGKFNERLNPGKKQREPTFHVVLDAVALTPCYSAFLITSDVPEICPRVYGQNFDELLTDEDIFKKPGSPRLSTVPGSPDEPTRKSKRVKRPAKKSFDALTIGIVIRETPVKSLSKKKAKMNVEKCKGIDMLSKMALTKEAHDAKIKPSVINERTGVKPRVPDVTEEETTESEEKEDEFVKTLSNDTDEEEETKIKDKDEGDKDEGMDYTTNQIDDDVDLRINEPVTTDEGFIQKEGND
nr:hypothetical protein [Tanacetum cinerariifolium]